jgi:hypothetical protein
MRAVAARNVGGLACTYRSIRPFQAGEHTAVRVRKVHELGVALDLDPALGQAIDQQPFVLVLRKDQRVRER